MGRDGAAKPVKPVKSVWNKNKRTDKDWYKPAAAAVAAFRVRMTGNNTWERALPVQDFRARSPPAAAHCGCNRSFFPNAHRGSCRSAR